MNDSRIEDVLRGYRPVGPPPHLRDRILAQRKPPRMWPWAAAAAILLLSLLSFRLAIRQEVDLLTPTLGLVTLGDLRDDLTEMFGDDSAGRELVNFLLREEAVRE